MILPDGSTSRNLARTIPEAITTIQVKKQLQNTLKMAYDHMTLIDEEIMASSARKFRKSSIARVHSPNSTPNNGTQRREQINSMREYQQHVDAVTMEKMKRFYIF